MAEIWTRASGRYLKALRERRGLSLQDVQSLSQPFADQINKGYLSRCENGRQRIAFSKIIPLSRIYEVPADVLLERMELDMELDRVGGPNTEGLTFAELTSAGREALSQGYKWQGYGYLRDALALAGTGCGSSLTSSSEQAGRAYMNCATAAMSLGRLLFAVHEYKYLEQSNRIGPRLLTVLLERLSTIHRHLNKGDEARAYAERALGHVESTQKDDFLGDVYSNRAMQALFDSDLDLGAEFFQKAHRAYRDVGRLHDCSRSLNNLGQVYFDLGRYRAARRSLDAAEKLISPNDQPRAIALGRILLGEIEAVENNGELAERRWKEAVELSKRVNDKVIRFKAEYLLWKQAVKQGNEPVARSIHRRLERLSYWVPSNMPELRAFRGVGAPSQ